MCTTTKQEQRKIVKEKLNNMSYFDRGFKSQMICDDIIRSGTLDKHSHILFYKAMIQEVNVDWLLEFAVSKGKECYLPKVNGNNMDLIKYPCKLEKGAFGIMEPVGQAVSTTIDLCIVPVMAVDKKGNRLGKGKGYYDRFFEKYPNCVKVAVAFKEQELYEIVTEEHDKKMDKIFVR
ncbi:MAG: 5-formyltetrahydrofolate cyclo-ligase [Clostridia bacterium]|nr:5-formyltetrahydrofolate cyclo-ligase [Clostridia bacterium]